MKLDEVRVLRDPIHGYIHIQDSIIWELIDTPQMQRLRRIRQLGNDSVIYHTAEHSRFSHSLGVYEICRRILEEVPGAKETLNPLEQTAVLCAALLHDIGHGPFSHSYEAISHVRHEEISCLLITSRQSEVCQILSKEDSRLPQMVAGILRHQAAKPLMVDLISSQLDCDRMDYLLRDAYETGTSYGSFDLERILRTLRVENGRLCIKRSGVHAVEDYIMARYQMYWQVYLHPDATGYDLLTHSFFERYKTLRKTMCLAPIEPVFDSPFDVERFLYLDDGAIHTGIQMARTCSDPILSDLARRIMDRRLFEWYDAPNKDAIEQLKAATIAKGYDPRYYFLMKTIRLEEFLPYQESESNCIRVLDEGIMKPLSKVSVVVRALLEMKETQKVRVYIPRDVKADNLKNA